MLMEELSNASGMILGLSFSGMSGSPPILSHDKWMSCHVTPGLPDGLCRKASPAVPGMQTGYLIRVKSSLVLLLYDFKPHPRHQFDRPTGGRAWGPLEGSVVRSCKVGRMPASVPESWEHYAYNSHLWKKV